MRVDAAVRSATTSSLLAYSSSRSPRDCRAPGAAALSQSPSTRPVTVYPSATGSSVRSRSSSAWERRSCAASSSDGSAASMRAGAPSGTSRRRSATQRRSADRSNTSGAASSRRQNSSSAASLAPAAGSASTSRASAARARSASAGRRSSAGARAATRLTLTDGSAARSARSPRVVPSRSSARRAMSPGSARRSAARSGIKVASWPHRSHSASSDSPASRAVTLTANCSWRSAVQAGACNISGSSCPTKLPVLSHLRVFFFVMYVTTFHGWRAASGSSAACARRISAGWLEPIGWLGPGSCGG